MLLWSCHTEVDWTWHKIRRSGGISSNTKSLRKTSGVPASCCRPWTARPSAPKWSDKRRRAFGSSKKFWKHWENTAYCRFCIRRYYVLSQRLSTQKVSPPRYCIHPYGGSDRRMALPKLCRDRRRHGCFMWRCTVQASCGHRTDQPQAVRIRPGGKLFVHNLNQYLDNLHEDACVILHECVI